MILAAHQPDLFPFPGFWRKMADADQFDVAIYDPFQPRGYNRRVKMRDRWASLAVEACPGGTAIKDVRLAPDAISHLVMTIEGRYRDAPFFKERMPIVGDMIGSARSRMLWQFNFGLILGMRDWLGISTPLSIATVPSGSTTTIRLDDVASQYAFWPEESMTYLSGPGGREYIDDDEFSFPLRFHEFDSPTSDSILTLMFDEMDPLRAMGMP